MRTFRTMRVEGVIARELSAFIKRDVEFPLGTLVTISEVTVSSKKMELAKVMVSVIPSEKADEVMEILNRARGQLQHALNRKMNIMPMPKIMFVYDRGLEQAARIEKVMLDEQKKEEKKKEQDGSAL